MCNHEIHVDMVSAKRTPQRSKAIGKTFRFVPKKDDDFVAYCLREIQAEVPHDGTLDILDIRGYCLDTPLRADDSIFVESTVSEGKYIWSIQIHIYGQYAQRVLRSLYPGMVWQR